MTTDLFPYQNEAVDMVLDLGYGLIAYEMGLGKTMCGIAIVEELLADPAINFAMIVVPSGLRYEWAQAIAQHTDTATVEKKIRRRGKADETLIIPDPRTCVVIDGPPKKRADQYAFVEDNWPDYVILSYEQVVNDFEMIESLDPECVILDEATAIKGFKANRSKAVKSLNPEFAVALSGTPLENKPEEVYSIMEFVCPEYLGNFRSFDTKFIVRNGFGGVKRYRNLDVLHRRLSKVMARKTRLDPDVAPYMPSVSHKQEYVFLSKKSQRLYDRIAKETLKELENSTFSGSFDLQAYYTGQGGEDMSQMGRIAARIMALQMLCDHPDLLRASAKRYRDSEGLEGSKYAAQLADAGQLDDLGKPEKMMAVCEDVEAILDSHPNNKIIIFSFFKDMGKYLQEALPFDSVLYNGDMTATEKAAAKARFQNRPECRLFIATDAGAFGVDLPQANYLINYDLVESAGKMDQRNARHVRAGSSHDNVFVINYLVDGSIEERTFSRLAFKRRVSTAVVDGRTAKDGVIENDVDSLTEFLTDCYYEE